MHKDHHLVDLFSGTSNEFPKVSNNFGPKIRGLVLLSTKETYVYQPHYWTNTLRSNSAVFQKL